jgi:hypothetical protein
MAASFLVVSIEVLTSNPARSRAMRNWAAIHCAVGLCVIAGTSFVRADDRPAGEMVDNPIYKHWAAFKAGATVTMRERVKFPAQSEEGIRYPEGTLVKDTTYKLLSVNPQRVVVEVTEAEHGRGSLQENAPFKITYYAKVKKGLGSPKSLYSHHKQEDVEVQSHGKTYRATLVETTHEHGPASRSQRIWISDQIPGGIVKEEKVQKQGGEIVSQSTLEILKSHNGS